MTETLVIGDLKISLAFTINEGSWYQRNIRDYVAGKVKIFTVTGPHDLDFELHLISLENGEQWVTVGEKFTGPKWIWRQTKERLTMKITSRDEILFSELSIPSPSKKNPDVYTSSSASIMELGLIINGFNRILIDNGGIEIGTRKQIFNDKSSRKNYVCVTFNEESNVCIIAYCMTKIIPLLAIYDKNIDDKEIISWRRSSILQSTDNREDEVSSIIAKGESSTVEFKPAVWYKPLQAAHDVTYKPKKDSVVAHAVVKTVAGFLNAQGGTLFVGVSDDGNAYGLEEDIKLTKRKDEDGLENEINQLLSNYIPKEIIASRVKLDLPMYKGKIIARLVVERAKGPVFIRTNDKEYDGRFYVRIGNATEPLSTESGINYIRKQVWE